MLPLSTVLVLINAFCWWCVTTYLIYRMIQNGGVVQKVLVFIFYAWSILFILYHRETEILIQQIIATIPLTSFLKYFIGVVLIVGGYFYAILDTELKHKVGWITFTTLFLVFLSGCAISLFFYPRVSFGMLQTIDMFILAIFAMGSSCYAAYINRDLFRQKLNDRARAHLYLFWIAMSVAALSVIFLLIDAIVRLFLQNFELYTHLYMIGYGLFGLTLWFGLLTSAPDRLIHWLLYLHKFRIYLRLKKLSEYIDSKSFQKRFYPSFSPEHDWMSITQLELEIYRLFIAIFDSYPLVQQNDQALFDIVHSIELDAQDYDDMIYQLTEISH